MECAVYDEMVERETVTDMPWNMRQYMAFMHQEFIMYLQPIVEIGSGKIMSRSACTLAESGTGTLCSRRFP